MSTKKPQASSEGPKPAAKGKAKGKGGSGNLTCYVCGKPLSDTTAHPNRRFCKRDNDGAAAATEGGSGSLAFDESAWADTLAFIIDPAAPLEPLQRARRVLMTSFNPGRARDRKRRIELELFRMKVNATALGYRALAKAVDAAAKEVEAM